MESLFLLKKKKKEVETVASNVSKYETISRIIFKSFSILFFFWLSIVLLVFNFVLLTKFLYMSLDLVSGLTNQKKKKKDQTNSFPPHLPILQQFVCEHETY